MNPGKEGGCICGSIRYKTHKKPSRVTVCHCTWCQRRTGSAFGIETVYNAEDVSIAGDTLQSYRHISDESGRWLDVEFCSRCGTNIGFTLEAVPGIRTISAGTFDDPSWINPDDHQFRHVYTRTARCWSEIPEGIEQYEAHFRK